MVRIVNCLVVFGILLKIVSVVNSIVLKLLVMVKFWLCVVFGKVIICNGFVVLCVVKVLFVL